MGGMTGSNCELSIGVCAIVFQLTLIKHDHLAWIRNPAASTKGCQTDRQTDRHHKRPFKCQDFSRGWLGFGLRQKGLGYRAKVDPAGGKANMAGVGYIYSNAGGSRQSASMLLDECKMKFHVWKYERILLLVGLTVQVKTLSESEPFVVSFFFTAHPLTFCSLLSSLLTVRLSVKSLCRLKF